MDVVGSQRLGQRKAVSHIRWSKHVANHPGQRAVVPLAVCAHRRPARRRDDKGPSVAGNARRRCRSAPGPAPKTGPRASPPNATTTAKPGQLPRPHKPDPHHPTKTNHRALLAADIAPRANSLTKTAEHGDVP